jgi:hypothetical protein
MWNHWRNGNKVHVSKAITSISIATKLGIPKYALMGKKHENQGKLVTLRTFENMV